MTIATTTIHKPRSVFFASLMPVIAGIGFCLAAATATADTTKTISTKTQQTDALNVLQQFHQALHAGNADAALALLTDNAQIYESGHAETRAQYIDHHLQADIAFAKTTTGTSNNTVTDCSAELCVIHQQTHTTGSYKAKNIDSKGTETAILRLTAQGWRISHVHWSNQ